MKKIFATLIIASVSYFSYAQNIFPTTGNVGIGTTSPSQALQVNGNILTSNSSMIGFNNDIIHYFIQGIGNGLQYTPFSVGNFTFSSGSGNWAFTNGNVGIGTTSPAAPLDVLGTGAVIASTARVNSIFSQDHTNSRGIILGYDSAGQIGVIAGSSTGSPSNIAFWNWSGSNWFEAMRLTSSGYLGIGTTTPGSLLSLGIHGTTTAANANMLRIYDNGTNSYGLGLNTSTGEFATTTGTGGFHTFYTGNTEKMRINLNGNVGIGTTSPDQALTVNGTIHSKSVVVDVNIFPDYVFKATYHLPSLTEVKTYIDKNHHLPDVPSAADVEKNGLNLGEMNKVLVQKVEELTLYLMEQHKQLADQQKTNQSQQKQIDELKKSLDSINHKKFK